MALTQKLEVRQSQALVMTPQLMQAIKLLQLSNLDLATYVEGELERNPLLERSPESDGEAGAATSEARPEETDSADWGGEQVPVARASEDRLDTGLENVFPDAAGASPPRGAAETPMAYSQWAGVGAGGREDADFNLESFVSAETTLADHLAEQLMLAIADPARRMIGQYL